MTGTVSVILITACCFFAAILNLALKTRFRSRVMGASSAVAICVGIFMYGYAYSRASGLSAATVLKALLTVCRMFGGVNDFAAVAATPLFRGEAMIALFWLAHFLAFYVTASAAIETLGKRLMQYVRTRMVKRGGLTLIYGATPETARLVRPREKNHAAVLVSEQDDGATAALAEAMGGVAFTGGTLRATADFLRSIGIGGSRRRLDVYCLSDDGIQNLRYAEALLEGLEARGVESELTSLFLLGVPEEKAAHLPAQEGRYGYGHVFASEYYDLIARLAVQKLPPWACMTFDGEARATKDFRVFVVGFGQMGRALLKQLVMNGQMEGSAFHAEVFDRRMDDLRGYMSACYPELLKAYDISLNAADADSEAFYEKLASQRPDVIALCGGRRKENGEIALRLERLYAASERRPRIVQCVGDGVLVDDEEYRLDSVDVRDMDRRAMALNHVYCRGESPEADWRDCDPFSRASCRASADFAPALLAAAGVSREQALAGKWPPGERALENLSRTEHLRWCAFHLAMGYRPMSAEEFERRAERYRRGEEKRISKNARGKTHACLTPWEALDALSARENAVTGGSVDYKAMDRDNVLAITRLLE